MPQVVTTRWVERGTRLQEGDLIDFSQTLGITPVTAGALFRRGILNETDGREFLSSRLASLPDPFLLPGMQKAVDRLVLAIKEDEKIAIHGDYDVDGITGTALLVEALTCLGARVQYHIPLRLKDGYGLSAEALRDAAKNEVAVVLSVDCGVSAVKEGDLSAELGLDLIITDHHQPPPELPLAHAIVNPHLEGNLFPFPELAGVGVAFFLLVALRKTLREAGYFAQVNEPDLRRFLDLVALGTIADMVPLKGVNRTLAKVGLAILNSSSRQGISCLQKVAGAREITCGTVGFQLAPRLNAAGRLEDAAMGVDLLLAEDANRAAQLAELLDGFNRSRQLLEKETFEQAIACLEGASQEIPYSIVLADSRWHPGVIGIVASRLVERYHRPVVLIALENGVGKGSARSIPGFHLYRALQSCEEYLMGYGGHEFAAGLTLCATQLEAFARAMNRYAQTVLTEEDLKPRLLFDGEIDLRQVDLDQVRELERLRPFGAGNPEPLFRTNGLAVRQVERVGENHLRWSVRQGDIELPCIGFGMAGRIEGLSGEVDMLFTPTINEWRGRISIQLRVKDFRPHEG